MPGGTDAVPTRIERCAPSIAIHISSIVLFGLWFGVYKSKLVERNKQRLADLISERFTLLEFSSEDAEAAGQIRAVLEARKQPIGPYDTLIAGQALARGLTLVTANHREFACVEGLQWEDWARE